MSEYPQRRAISEEKEKKFLEHLKTMEMNVSAAARAAGLKGTGGLYRHRRDNPEFAERWAEIEDEILDGLEEDQYRDAKTRSEDRRYVLSRRRAKRWSEKAAIAVAVGPTDAVPQKPIGELTDDDLMAIAASAGAMLGPAEQNERDGRRAVEGEILEADQPEKSGGEAE